MIQSILLTVATLYIQWVVVLYRHGTYEGAISYLNESYHIWLIQIWYGSFICAMTHSCASHDWFICATIDSYVTWLIHIGHDSYTCAMTHLYEGRGNTTMNQMCHDSFICLIYMCHDLSTRATTHKLCHNSFTCAMIHLRVPWLVCMSHDSYTCAMTHACEHRGTMIMHHMRHDSFTCAMTHAYVPWLIHPYPNTFIWAQRKYNNANKSCHRQGGHSQKSARY